MRVSVLLLIGVWSSSSQAFAVDIVAHGLQTPRGLCVDRLGTVYVAEAGEPGVDGDGQISVIRDGKQSVLVEGLDDPLAVSLMKDALYVCDKNVVKRVSLKGPAEAEVFLEAGDFPGGAGRLFAIETLVDAKADLMAIVDVGDSSGSRRAMHVVDVKSKKIKTFDDKKLKEIKEPRGVVFDGSSFALVIDHASGLYRVNLESGATSKLQVAGLTSGKGLSWDDHGHLYLTSAMKQNGKDVSTLWGVPRPGRLPINMTSLPGDFGDVCVDPTDEQLLVIDETGGSVLAFSKQIPGWEVDTSPLENVSLEPAFPGLIWTGWDDGSDSGKPTQHRPILLTHTGDGSGRIFVPLQQGPIHVFKAGDKATKVFLDLSDRSRYLDKQNEEGLLGLAFSPDYQTSGEFYVFYTLQNAEHTNVVSRFRVSRDDPNKADPNSEEILLRVDHPYWNHDGGTLLFGQDGYLYVVLGDGGSGNDPHNNGQNLGTLLGSILRLDVQKRQSGYGIPVDNPFVGKEGARPEIYAYGVRNPWRVSMDRKTGELWVAEVGQNLYEEINILTPGANLGWSVREGFHPFGAEGVDVSADILEPIWEYHHDIGRSITGGQVYRGTKSPSLDGTYFYSDYVTNLVWGLTYDAQKGRITANRRISAPKVAWMSLGEDEAGEVYIMGYSIDGQGIYRFVAK